MANRLREAFEHGVQVATFGSVAIVVATFIGEDHGSGTQLAFGSAGATIILSAVIHIAGIFLFMLLQNRGADRDFIEKTDGVLTNLSRAIFVLGLFLFLIGSISLFVSYL